MRDTAVDESDIPQPRYRAEMIHRGVDVAVVVPCRTVQCREVSFVLMCELV